MTESPRSPRRSSLQGFHPSTKFLKFLAHLPEFSTEVTFRFVLGRPLEDLSQVIGRPPETFGDSRE